MLQSDTGTNPTPPGQPCRLLIVDDSPEGRRSLSRLLELHGFQVIAVGDGTSALEVLRVPPPPLAVLTDLMLPDLDGREVAREALTLEPRPFIGLITGWSEAENDPDLRVLGIDQVFLKPLDIHGIVAALHQALNHSPGPEDE